MRTGDSTNRRLIPITDLLVYCLYAKASVAPGFGNRGRAGRQMPRIYTVACSLVSPVPGGMMAGATIGGSSYQALVYGASKVHWFSLQVGSGSNP